MLLFLSMLENQTACWWLAMYGVCMGYLASSWMQGNCSSYPFTCMRSSSTRLSHAQACESLYSLPTEHNSPSDWGYGITSFMVFPPLLFKASDLGPYCTYSSRPTADSTLYLSHLPLPLMHLPWHFSHSPPDTQQDSGSWRSYYQSTDYLLICCLAAAGCVKALILQLNFFTEGGTAEHELLYRGNYMSYRVTALT